MNTYVEGSLWKLKTSLTGTTWKKHWVVCDGAKLYQFKSKTKPPPNEAPKYTLDVTSSTVEYTNVRKFCFKINDNINHLSLVLAVDDFESYEKWLKATMKKEPPAIKEEKKNIVIENEEETEQELSVVSHEDKKSGHVEPKSVDPIWDYFRTQNCSQKDEKKPCLIVSKVPGLITVLDSTMNADIVTRLLMRDLNVGISSVISYADFLAWWKGCAPLRSFSIQSLRQQEGEEKIEPNTIVDISSSDSVHLVGFINSHTALDKYSHRSVFLSHLRLPSHDGIFESLKTPELYEVSDWNEVYQSAMESAYELSNALFLQTGDAEEGYYGDAQSEYSQNINSHAPSAIKSHSQLEHQPLEDDGMSVISDMLTVQTHSTRPTLITQQPWGSVHDHASVPSRNNSLLVPSVVPADSVSRNTVAHPSVVSRDGHIIPPHSQQSVVTGSVTQSLGHAGLTETSSMPPLPQSSPPVSPPRSPHSTVAHSVVSTARSNTYTLPSQPPPLPSVSYRGEDERSVRSSAPGLPVHNSGSKVVSAYDQWHAALEACLYIATVKGAFYRTAIDGARCIIDEYSLPDEMKTATKLSVDLVDTEGFHALPEGVNSAGTEVYALSGMLFSIAACPASTADAPPSLHSVAFSDAHGSSGESKDAHGAPEGAGGQHDVLIPLKENKPQSAAALERQALVSASDEVQHKIAGNEVRNTALLQAVIDILHAKGNLSRRIMNASPATPSPQADSTTRGNASFFGESQANLTTLPDLDSVAASYDSRIPPPLPPDQDAYALDPAADITEKPATLLTTVVDYAGFRVTVLCPTAVDESTTLVHGSSSLPVPNTEAGTATGPTIQVRASTQAPVVLVDLAAELNLSTYQRPHAVTSRRISQTDLTTTLPVRNVELLTSDLQVHAAADGRTYMLNLKNILPSALPRPHSYDVQTRQLRAEYVQSLNAPLKADILQQSGGRIGVHTETLIIAEAGMNITACKDLFSGLLPRVAATLDNYTSIPLDSCGLTQFLHSCGVNCRYIGVLYWLCSAPSVKQLLLSEALARCCKAVLGAQLRTHARKAKGVVLRAQHRGRSIQHDYKEFVSTAMLSQKATVLELFNLTLGWGPASDSFWSATLLDALNQKFGISSTKAHLAKQLHMPQLFLAMQHHTGTRFHDNPVYNLNTTLVVNPFNTQDIEEYFIPAAKVPLSLPGEVGQLCEQGEALLLNGLYREAASAFRLKQCTQRALFSDSGASSSYKVKSAPQTHQFSLAHTTYKLALSLYLSGQLAAAHRTMRQYLARCVRYHPITGRILTLLMCTEFKLGNPDRAAQYFDAAQEVYTYTLGPNHPIIPMHTNCLGDLYHSASAYQQARVMKLLAHVSAQKALGERHILTALIECRLAGSLIEQQDHYGAMSLLENCVEVFSAAVVEGGQFEYEASVCLYNLATCAFAMGDVDRAGQLALRCVDIASKLDHKKVNFYPMVVSCYFLLGDLALLKNQGGAAVGLLEQCWMLLQAIPSSFAQRKWAGNVMAVLSQRILSLLVAALPMAVRSLFDSVVAQWSRRQSILRSPHATPMKQRSHADPTSPLTVLDDDITVSTMGEMHGRAFQRAQEQEQARRWEHTCETVFTVMMKRSPKHFFDALIQGIQESALVGASEPEELEEEGAPPSISFAAQAAVVCKLVFQSTEGASHNYINL